ncbi:MAG TPA: thiamine-phosphate kinase [bacterium]|nr:thiamine-phosphate kinase [bacterium]
MEEEKIIEYVKSKIRIKNRDVLVGPGDDTAVLKYDSRRYLLLTTDTIVENIHFRRNEATLFQIGKKAMAVNLSDIAAMGGIPLYALVSVGLPEGSQNIIAPLLRGMEKMAVSYKFDIVGGNLSRAPFLFIDISMAGLVEKKYLKLRSGAGKGDGIYVTGKLGGSIMGKHLDIKPRIEESREIISRFPVTSMMDISDGISSDLTRLAKASGKGFSLSLDKIPLSEEAVRMSGSREEAIGHALNDGEDYELLFTVPASSGNKMARRVGKVSVTCIGEITEEKRYLGIYGNKTVEIKPSGFSHF